MSSPPTSPSGGRSRSASDVSGNPIRKFNNGWTKQQEQLMAEWADKSGCYRWLHDRCEKKYSYLNMSITIPVIILSTLTGTANFALDGFISPNDQDAKKYAQAGIIAMITFGYTATILEDTPLFHQQEKLHIVSEFDTSVSGIAENWISLDNPSLTLTKRIERWLELVRLASDLGYTMPRVQHHVAKFIKFLTINKKKNKKIYAITSD